MSLQIAVVGAGLIGKRHVEFMRQVPRLELSAIVDPADNAQQVADRFDVPKFDDLETLLKDAKPDGVILATPNSLHVPQALACVDAGVPVLVEKPVGISAKEAQALVMHAGSKNIPVMVGHHRRFNPIIQEAKRLIDQGVLGTIRSFEAICWYYKPEYYFDEAPWRKQNGAGPILVNAIHDIDLMRYLCGEIEDVKTIKRPAIRGYENEDIAVSIFQFENGAIGNYTISDAVCAPWSWEMTAGENPAYPQTQESCYRIGGSLASLSIPDMRLWFHQGEADWWNPITATQTPFAHAEPLINQLDHFADVILGDAAPLVSVEEGAKTLSVIETMLA